MSDGLHAGSNASVVQVGLDHARQTLFSAAEVPLASITELVTAVTSPAVKAVLEARIEQIVKHGHTADRDDELLLKVIPGHARSMVLDGMDLLGGPRRNLQVARRRFAKGAAMLIAAIDQLDRAIAASPDNGDGA